MESGLNEILGWANEKKLIKYKKKKGEDILLFISTGIFHHQLSPFDQPSLCYGV